MAALYGILYLEGCLGLHSQFCRIVPIGYPPLARPEQLAKCDEVQVKSETAAKEQVRNVFLEQQKVCGCSSEGSLAGRLPSAIRLLPSSLHVMCMVLTW